MIERLRKRFIGLAMVAFVLVLTGVMSVVNVLNYREMDRDAEGLLDILTENDGGFPPPLTPVEPLESIHRMGSIPPKLWPEAPFATRYFTVLLDEDGQVESVDTQRIAAVSATEAGTYAQAVWSKGSDSGYYGHYKYRITDRNGFFLVVFLDRNQELDAFRGFLFTSLLVSTVSLAMVFILLLLLSKRVIRPVAEGYEKQKEFITNAGHELKTPLTIIDANTEVLELEQGENRWTKSIRDQVKRLTGLTENLVALTRMEEASARLMMVEFSLSDAVREALEPFQSRAAVQGQSFDLHLADHVSYTGDEASLRQLVAILADNAIKYAPAGSIVYWELKKQGKNTILICENTEVAPIEGDLDRLFERFYRGDASRSNTVAGYGVGLSLARSIVMAHRGRIRAKNLNGERIRFIVVL